MIARLLVFLKGLLWWRKAQPEVEWIQTNRAMRRQMVKSQRLRGPGWTRSYRKGRTQRERFDA